MIWMQELCCCVVLSPCVFTCVLYGAYTSLWYYTDQYLCEAKALCFLPKSTDIRTWLKACLELCLGTECNVLRLDHVTNFIASLS